jgi:hypothetical protein
MEEVFGELDLSDPKQRKLYNEYKLEYLKTKKEERKKLNKTYLKGQRGVRRYYDYSKLDYDDDEDKDIDNEDIKDEDIDDDGPCPVGRRSVWGRCGEARAEALEGLRDAAALRA